MANLLAQRSAEGTRARMVLALMTEVRDLKDRAEGTDKLVAALAKQYGIDPRLAAGLVNDDG